MRPDLSSNTRFHFHGYPTLRILDGEYRMPQWRFTIGGSYLLLYGAGCRQYFWHLTTSRPPEHLQMGMVGPSSFRTDTSNRVIGDFYAGNPSRQADCGRRTLQPPTSWLKPVASRANQVHLNDGEEVRITTTATARPLRRRYPIKLPASIRNFTCGMTFKTPPPLKAS